MIKCFIVSFVIINLSIVNLNAGKRTNEEEGNSHLTSLKSVEKKRKTEDNQLTDIKKQLQNLQQSLIKIHNQPECWKALFEVYESFKTLTYPEEIWEEVVSSLKEESASFCIFPKQTLKEAVGGHYFYPTCIEKWIDYAPAEHLLCRRDIIGAFLVGEFFKDPRSQYYLAKVLWYNWKNFPRIRDIWENDPRLKARNFNLLSYIRSLRKKALASLVESATSPDACYIIGCSYYKNPEDLFEEPFCVKKPSIALEWFRKGRGLKNSFHALEVRKIYSVDSEPTIEEYKELGRQGCELALIEAAKMAKTYEEKLLILRVGEEMSYGPLLIEIGGIYEEMATNTKEKIEEHPLEKAREYYEEAGKKGFGPGYVALGESYVGDQFTNNFWLLNNISQNDIEAAVEAFTKAGQINDFAGWEHLAQLYEGFKKLAAKTRSENSDQQKKMYSQKRKDALRRVRLLEAVI